MTRYVRIEMQEKNGKIEVPMDKDAKHYRDIMSPSMQGMVDNGGYKLLNEKGQAVDIDAELPKQDDKTAIEPPLLRLQAVTLPRIWVGYYQDLIKNPLFCFLTKNDHTPKLDASIKCFTKGGFSVAPFTDEKKLKKALSNSEYVNLFNMVGLVADPLSIEPLWDIRKELIAEGDLDERKMPFACACYCGKDIKKVEGIQEAKLENGIVPATVDLSLGTEQFCEQMIYTLYFDDQYYLPMASTNGKMKQPNLPIATPVGKPEDIVRMDRLEDAVRMERKEFYTNLNTHYTDFLRDFTRHFKGTTGWPEPSSIRRLIREDQYLGESNLAYNLKDNTLRCFKKILDLGRCAIASPRLSTIALS